MSWEVVCADAYEYLSGMEPGSVDLTVTSPPYDSMRSYKGQEPFTFDKFQEVARELYRVMKPGGVVVWVVGDQTVKGSETGSSFRQALYFKEVGFNLHDTMIYQKTGSAYADKTRYFQQFEYMFVLSKGRPKTVNLLKDRPNKWVGKWGGNHRGGVCERGEYGIRFNVWQYPTGKTNTTRDDIAFKHPAVFPEQLAADHIASWSNPGDLVLDPFCGSGTTGKMAVLAGRDFLGVDCSEEYCALACERIGMYG